MKRGLALFVTVVTAGVLLRATGATVPNATVASVRLKTISSRVHNKGASLVIEATDPVGYVATRPDPLTITIDFRNVTGEGVANSVASDAKSPIAGVAVEAVESLGAPASRVRITLSQPVAHHVRSDRNTIVIDLDKPTGKPYVLPVVANAERSGGTNGSAPDAMKALEIAQSPIVDPIVALAHGRRRRAAELDGVARADSPSAAALAGSSARSGLVAGAVARAERSQPGSDTIHGESHQPRLSGRRSAGRASEASPRSAA